MTAASAVVRFIPTIVTRLVALILAIGAAIALAVACHWAVPAQPDSAGTGAALVVLTSSAANQPEPAEHRAAARLAEHDVVNDDDCSASHSVAVASTTLSIATRPELPSGTAADAETARRDAPAGNPSLAINDFQVVRVPHLLCVMRT